MYVLYTRTVASGVPRLWLANQVDNVPISIKFLQSQRILRNFGACTNSGYLALSSPLNLISTWVLG